MAHTFRNRGTVPAGWVVRDNGVAYFGGTEVATYNFRPAPYRRSIYRCEETGPRRQCNRGYRARTNHLVRTGRWEEILPPTRTSGWNSW